MSELSLDSRSAIDSAVRLAQKSTDDGPRNISSEDFGAIKGALKAAQGSTEANRELLLRLNVPKDTRGTAAYVAESSNYGDFVKRITELRKLMQSADFK